MSSCKFLIHYQLKLHETRKLKILMKAKVGCKIDKA